MTEQALTGYMTDVGFAADVNSYLSGQRLALTEFVLGSSPRVITGAEETIVDEVWRGPINRLAPTGEPGQFVAEVIVPSAAGPFTVQEGGVLDSAGRLIALAKFSRFDKVPAAGNQVNEGYFALVITVSHPENVELRIDPTTVTASRAYVADMVLPAYLMACINTLTLDTLKNKQER